MMRITRRQLRRIIREASEHAAEARGMAASYQRGYSDGWSTPRSPASTGRDPEYLRGYEKGAADAEDASGEAKYIREAEGSTKKYDDDSALKGDQSKLPDGLQKGIIDKTVEDREEHEEEEREEKSESVRITRRQLRNIIRESLLKEEMLKIISNPHSPETETFNRIANYALTNNIQGAMADPEVNTDELYWELDEMRPWVNRVGDKEGHWMDDDAVVPDNWDADAVYDFMEDLERAWNKDQEQKDAAAIAADPDKDWLKFMGAPWTATITPDDLETLGWKEYKRYIRLSPPASISHGLGELHIPNEDFEGRNSPGTREEFVEFLTNRAGKTLKKRKIYRAPPPIYD